MKVGDLVGYRDTWDDDKGLNIAGLVISIDREMDWHTVLLFSGGKIKQEYLVEVEVIYNGN